MTFTVLRNSCTLYTFTVLRQKALAFTLPPPYACCAGVLEGWDGCEVRLCDPSRVPVCARVSRMCPGSPGVFLPVWQKLAADPCRSTTDLARGRRRLIRSKHEVRYLDHRRVRSLRDYLNV
jgi:hypothetical protein